MSLPFSNLVKPTGQASHYVMNNIHEPRISLGDNHDNDFSCVEKEQL